MKTVLDSWEDGPVLRVVRWHDAAGNCFLRADLLLVIGMSLKVRSIADLPMVMKLVPQIVRNREPVA
jgi:NAD-dependent SIR2 family protein deacetylase